MSRHVPESWYYRSNDRSGVDAGMPLCLHSKRPRPGATHRDCWPEAETF